MWKIPFTHPTPPIPKPLDPVTQALLDQNRILLEVLRHSGVVLPRLSSPPSGPPTKRTEADVSVVSRGRRVEIQIQETLGKLPDHILHPKPIEPGQSSSSGTQVVGGFSAMTSTSPAMSPSPTSTPSPSPDPSTGPK